MRTKIAIFFLLLSSSLSAVAEVPLLIKCEGRLYDGEQYLEGLVDVKLQIYSAETGGELLYEDQNKVEVDDGFYSTFMGDNTTKGSLVAALSGGNAYLGVVANGKTYPARERLLTVPYAMVSEAVVSAGVTADMLGPESVQSIHLGARQVTGDKIAEGSITSVAIADGSITAEDIAPGSITIDKLKAGGNWSTSGNVAESGKFSILGTLDNRPLDIKVNDKRVMRFEPTPGSPNIIAGSEENQVRPGIGGVVLAGGGDAAHPNVINNHFSVISGGAGNSANGEHATVSGGIDNQANSDRSSVGGGRLNNASGPTSSISGGFSNTTKGSYSTIAGGHKNEASGYVSSIGGGWGNNATGVVSVVSGGQDNKAHGSASTISGGVSNLVTGAFSTIPGGSSNIAAGDYSFAAGRNAHARHEGSIVFADSQAGSFSSSRENQFIIRAEGNVGIGTENPDEKLTVAGGVKADRFIGDGSGLTGLSMTQLDKPVLTTDTTLDGDVSGKINAVKLKPNTVTTDKIADGAVTLKKLAKIKIPAEHIEGSALTEQSIFDGDLSGKGTVLKLRPGSVTAKHIKDGTISGKQLANGSIGLEKLAGVKFDATSIQGNALTEQSVFSGDVMGQAGVLAIKPGSVTSEKIADGAITADKLAKGVFPKSSVEGINVEAKAESLNVKIGHKANRIKNKNGGASILGGGSDAHPNTITDDYGTIGGGFGNKITGFDGTISGGQDNRVSGIAASVNGGFNNIAEGKFSNIGGGVLNNTGGDLAVVGGGFSNVVRGAYATIPGGYLNKALGDYSFAAGRSAHANHSGSFVWADATNEKFVTSGPNQYRVRAGGGLWFYSSSDLLSGVRLSPGSGSFSMLSAKEAKENLAPIDDREVLNRLKDIPLYMYNYKAQKDEVKHVGPVAQDFYEAFGLGEDERYISSVDADGIAFSAIRGLNEIIGEKESQIEDLENQNLELKARVSELEEKMEKVFRHLTK